MEYMWVIHHKISVVKVVVLRSKFLCPYQLKVKMRPKPWSKRWERPKFNIKGIHFDLALSPEQMEHAQKWAQPWLEYDMLKEYDTSKLEQEVYTEVQQELNNQEKPSAEIKTGTVPS